VQTPEVEDQRATAGGGGGPGGRHALDVELEHRWLVRVWVLVALFAVVAAARSAQLGIPFRDPHGSYFLGRAFTSLCWFAALVVLDAVVRTGWRGWSVQAATGVLRRRWPRRRLLLALGGLLAWHLVYFCYHNLKSWDVFQAPRDGLLLHVDRWLFLGHSPAVLLHGLLGQHLAAYVLAFVYQSFSHLETVSFVAALALTPRLRDGFVFIASGMWVWVLGVGSYYLIPTLGPFSSAPQDFLGLAHTSIQDTQALYLAQRAHLLTAPHAPDAAAQISAFASLHVAYTALMMLMARYYGLRRTSRALAVWLVATAVATVYLGWHYTVDDVAGLLIAVASVGLGSWLVYPERRPASAHR
jgi:membrane-associated phospholipid phosphatase